jgi:hypothetical protein
MFTGNDGLYEDSYKIRAFSDVTSPTININSTFCDKTANIEVRIRKSVNLRVLFIPQIRLVEIFPPMKEMQLTGISGSYYVPNFIDDHKELFNLVIFHSLIAVQRRIDEWNE